MSLLVDLRVTFLAAVIPAPANEVGLLLMMPLLVLLLYAASSADTAIVRIATHTNVEI